MSNAIKELLDPESFLHHFVMAMLLGQISNLGLIFTLKLQM
jgi:hypothetical protein